MRRTLAKLRHSALPAVLVAGLALAVPMFTATGTETEGVAGSVVAKAAQAGGSPGGDQRYPVGGGAMESARAVAVAHWGANPCSGAYTVRWTPLDLGTNATATWRNPTDAWNNAGANFDCRIDINPQADYDFPKLCTVLTHEMGHLLGRQHDPNPGQLMSAYYSTPLPACQRPEPSGTAPVAAPLPAEDDADGVDIIVTDEPRRALRKKSARTRTKTVERCVFRKAKSGRRVKRCRTMKVEVSAKKAGTTTRTVRRCVFRKAKSGKRIKRCRTMKVKVSAKKGSAKKRPAEKAGAKPSTKRA